MSSDRASLREIDWLGMFPWLGLARTIGIAWGPSKLLLALVGMTLTTAGWLAISRAYVRYGGDDAVIKRQATDYENSETWRTPPAHLNAQSDVLSTATATA